MYECKVCKLKYKQIIEDKCVFCSIIYENKKSNIYNICIGYSNMEQIDIIHNTYKYFLLHDKIPKPNEIDNNVQIININSYIFREFINYCIKDKKFLEIIDKFKIFFTNTIDLNKIKSKKFPLTYKIEKLNILYIKTDLKLSDINNNFKYFDKFINLYKDFTHLLYNI
jgi:hypothetical protein